MKIPTQFKVSAVIVSLLCAVQSYALTYAEVGDAGQTLGTAQTVAAGTNVITGNANNGADLFRFGWSGGAFYVNSTGTPGDSQLFLFDSAGVGVLGNDDGIAFAGPAYLQTSSLMAGIYYLGISGYDYDPHSAGGLIFQSFPYDPVYGPSNTSPLTHWTGNNFGLGSYQINFQQITSDGTPIGNPNPTGSVPDAGSSIALLGLGMAALALMQRRRNA